MADFISYGNACNGSNRLHDNILIVHERHVLGLRRIAEYTKNCYRKIILYLPSDLILAPRAGGSPALARRARPRGAGLWHVARACSAWRGPMARGARRGVWPGERHDRFHRLFYLQTIYQTYHNIV